mmetsp:Transcript_3409/g.5990  ORF Transcript_3409/g.5990 Transcript_3409/m.5990 type:complete len:216 (+) Transcript_3409:263-910(+)
MVAQLDEIGDAQLRSGHIIRVNRRRQKTGRALQRRVGQAHPGQEEDGNAHHPELRILEIELLFLGVMDDLPGADFPDRRRVVEADLAGRGDSLIKLRIAALGMGDLGRGDLQLAVQNQPRGLQDAVLQISGKLSEISDKDHVTGLIHEGQRALHAQVVRRAVIGDGFRAQAHAFVEHLHRADGRDSAAAVKADVVRDERCRRRRLLCRPRRAEAE